MPVRPSSASPEASPWVFCANCHGLRVSPGGFVPVSEQFRSEREATASHSICPDCAKKLYGIDAKEYVRLASLPVGSAPADGCAA